MDCDLTSRKKEIDELVMQVVDSLQDEESEDESESEEEKPVKKRAAKNTSKKHKASSDSDDEDDFKPKSKAKKSKKNSDSDTDSEASWKKAKKPAAKKAKGTGKGKGTGFTRPYKLSADLASVVGADEMPRHEVVKKVWAIIKERNLYDPKNKQFAICDSELQKVMGVKRFRTFGMLKYLKVHFLD